MQTISNMLYTPVDFTRFVVKNFTDPQGSLKTAKGFSDNVGLVAKVIKCASIFGVSCSQTDKLEEQCKTFKKVYSLFNFAPSCIDAIQTLATAPNPADNAFNSRAFQVVLNVTAFVRNIFGAVTSVADYVDPFNIRSLTPFKYLGDSLDIVENSMGLVDDSKKIYNEASKNASDPVQNKARVMKIVSATWSICKKITCIAAAVIGVLTVAFAGSLGIPFFVVPVLGLTASTFGLFSKYVDYYAKNPNHAQVA